MSILLILFGSLFLACMAATFYADLMRTFGRPVPRLHPVVQIVSLIGMVISLSYLAWKAWQ